MITREQIIQDLVSAYFDCRKNKKTKKDCIKFELNLEENICELADDIINGTYKPKPSKAFIVNYPVKREIFAADMRDRVIHHYIALRVEPLMEEIFIDDSYNCRKGKGTLYGVDRLTNAIRKETNNWTKPAWCLSLDIQGFFMSIDKNILYKKVLKLLENYDSCDKEILINLIKETIFNKIQENYIRVCPKKEWIGLPKNKSLFHTKENFGITLGNLTSQLFANFYLAELDRKMKKRNVSFYCRYVDDIRIIDSDKNKLIKVKSLIEKDLRKIGLNLHPNKTQLREVHRGVKFIGTMIMPHRNYVINRVVKKLNNKISSINNQNEINNIDKVVSSINSYFGMMRNQRTYNIRLKAFSSLNNNYKKYIYGTKHLHSVKINKQYKNKMKLWQEQNLWVV